jgi:hypothetical protein
MDRQNTSSYEPLSRKEIYTWVNIGCWVALVLTPLLRYVNGPAVSTDQFLIRIGLLIISVVGILLLHIAARTQH